MFKKMIILALVVMFSCVSTQAMSAGQPGTTDTVFNRRFIQKLKPMMLYEQLVKIVGTPGTKVGEDKRSSPPRTMYHWNGRRRSALDIRVAGGKVIELTVTTPKKQHLSLGKSGELIEVD